MTTGIDYDTQFIGMTPDEASRSILELLEIERTGGYTDMTNDEIARLIRYKENNAEQGKIVSDNRANNEAMLKQMNETVQKQLEHSSYFFNTIINMEPALVRVDGSEVD